MAPMYMGRFGSGTATEMMVKAPFIRPAPPRPAMARLMMSMLDDCETPHSSEPSSKMAKKIRKTFLELKYV